MSRRTVAGLLALGLAAALVLVAALQRVPYVTYKPGPTVNVLGEYGGEKIVQIKGHKTYEDGGALRLLTVYESRRDQELDLVTVLAGWISPTTNLIPFKRAYPDNQTAAQDREESALQMTSSQDNATVVAMRAAGIDFKTTVIVGAVTDNSPAVGVLKIDDELLEVDGKPVVDVASLITQIRTLKPGKPVSIVLRRKGVVKTVTLKPRSDEVPVEDASPAEQACPSGDPLPVTTTKVTRIGFTPAPRYDYPFDVKINLGNSIGGPSAGMMFALTIYDLLTPGSLTGGSTVAGTGEISSDGIVGQIGGISQKIAGAQRDGARLFLVPSENWSQAIHSDYDKSKIKLVRVHTIQDALTAINTWRENPDAELKGCAG